MMKGIKVIALVFFLTILGQTDFFRPLMLWDKELIVSGEYWRLVSSSFTHTNFQHALINLLVLMSMSVIFEKTKESLGFVLFGSLSVGLFLCFIPKYEMVTYSGLSGMLHGYFFLMVMSTKEFTKGLKRMLVFAVIGKVLFEIAYGASKEMSGFIDAVVATESHLIGLLAGIVYWLMLKTIKK